MNSIENDFDLDLHLKYFLKTKTGYFSFAKNMQQANFISRLVAPDGKLSSWTHFRNTILDGFPDYDIIVLEKEFNSFYCMAKCYQIWKNIEIEKDIFPYLKYDAIQDGETCSICNNLNSIIRPVDDPFWDIYFPPNCESCRCDVQKIDAGRVRLTDLSKKHLIEPREKYALNVGKHELKLGF